MNKQELIERIKGLKNIFGSKVEYIEIDAAIELVSKLDEPRKVKVPQCVSEYIEFKKKNNFHVYGAMRVIEDHYDKKVPDWFYEGNIEKFCLAWLLGYEVEEEKRYLVKIKATKHYLAKDGNGKIFFSLAFKGYFTKKELEEAGFGWVFSCEGIEVEEVEG